MTPTEIVIGILLILLLLGFGFYGALAVRHAARFRYLSRRTIYLTIFFVTTSTLLIAACLFVYFEIAFS